MAEFLPRQDLVNSLGTEDSEEERVLREERGSSTGDPPALPTLRPPQCWEWDHSCWSHVVILMSSDLNQEGLIV